MRGVKFNLFNSHSVSVSVGLSFPFASIVCRAFAFTKRTGRLLRSQMKVSLDAVQMLPVKNGELWSGLLRVFSV